MKYHLYLMFLTLPILAMAVDEPMECEEEVRSVNFKCPPTYEDSVVVDPIEREPTVMRPSSHESSFYEQMTR